VLHKLLGEEVEVLRVLPHGKVEDSQQECSFSFAL
jgi:hypothetical protein